MTKWTKGPWRVGWPSGEGQGEGKEGCWVLTENMTPVVAGGIDDWSLPKGPSKENAHLISAAPELYEALAAAWDFIDAYGDSRKDKTLLDKIDAALAKARGESND